MNVITKLQIIWEKILTLYLDSDVSSWSTMSIYNEHSFLVYLHGT